MTIVTIMTMTLKAMTKVGGVDGGVCVSVTFTIAKYMCMHVQQVNKRREMEAGSSNVEHE